ncbi:membrane protein [gut metagenome]|uniref:Membrane protein n=1 Tax=gut metagenome TaxID=749906 RepID=J9H1P6_9ZZZZ
MIHLFLKRVILSEIIRLHLGQIHRLRESNLISVILILTLIFSEILYSFSTLYQFSQRCLVEISCILVALEINGQGHHSVISILIVIIDLLVGSSLIDQLSQFAAFYRQLVVISLPKFMLLIECISLFLIVSSNNGLPFVLDIRSRQTQFLEILSLAVQSIHLVVLIKRLFVILLTFSCEIVIEVQRKTAGSKQFTRLSCSHHNGDTTPVLQINYNLIINSLLAIYSNHSIYSCRSFKCILTRCKVLDFVLHRFTKLGYANIIFPYNAFISCTPLAGYTCLKQAGNVGIGKCSHRYG